MGESFQNFFWIQDHEADFQGALVGLEVYCLVQIL